MGAAAGATEGAAQSTQADLAKEAEKRPIAVLTPAPSPRFQSTNPLTP